MFSPYEPGLAAREFYNRLERLRRKEEREYLASTLCRNRLGRLPVNCFFK